MNDNVCEMGSNVVVVGPGWGSPIQPSVTDIPVRQNHSCPENYNTIQFFQITSVAIFSSKCSYSDVLDVNIFSSIYVLDNGIGKNNFSQVAQNITAICQ